MPLRKKLPKFLQRRNSGRSTHTEDTHVIQPSPLSPVLEHADAIPIHPSPHGSPGMRPVPPPHSHIDDFGDHEMHHDDFVDDLHEPQSRLYETFTPSTNAHSIPRVIREDEGDEGLHFTHSDGHMHHEEGTRSMHPDELGMINTEGSHPAVYIAPSEGSHSSNSSSQKVTFLGDLSNHDRTPSMHRRALSTSSRSIPTRERSLGVPLTASSLRYNDYGRPRRHISDHLLSKPPPKIRRPDRPYGFRYPYMILTDFGEGLEIGNEDDGFMRYEDYLDSSHLRRNREDTYYIIPGSTPVVFHDEDGNEIYSVDAWKYNTPHLRRKQYIVQDEHGRELFRVGGSGSRRSSSDGYSSPDRVTYLPSSSSTHPRSPKYQNYKRSARSNRDYASAARTRTRTTPLARSALFEDDDRTVSSKISSNPDIVVVNEEGQRIYDSRESLALPNAGARTPLTQSQYVTEVSYPSRPETGFDDDYGQAMDRSDPVQYPWGTSGSSSTESDNYSYSEGAAADSRRRSRVFRT